LIERQFADELVVAQLFGAAQVALCLGDAHLDFIEIPARRLELALGEIVDGLGRRIVEACEQLAFLHCHAFFDQHLGDFARDLRGNCRLAPRDDVAGCIEDRRAATTAA
jgi:hypothetical protein